MTSLDVRLTVDGHLQEVVTYKRWSVTGSFTNSNLTDGSVRIMVRWSLKRGGCSRRFHCSSNFS